MANRRNFWEHSKWSEAWTSIQESGTIAVLRGSKEKIENEELRESHARKAVCGKSAHTV
jgi:hypothetical protein